MLGMLFLTAAFNMIDLFTTAEATRSGLIEGNPVLTALAHGLSVNMLDIVLLTKALFIAGITVFGFLGLQSRDQPLRKMIYGCVLAFSIIFLVVAVNNIILTRA
jgi:hypothetical protein